MCIRDSAKTTVWQLSYDGRKNEPVTLPMKFPLLLAQGADGIAVGLSTKILPHNFCELIDSSIKSVSYTHLRAHETVLDLVCRLLLEKKKQQILYLITCL